MWVGNLVLKIATFASALEKRVCQVLFAPIAVGNELQDAARVSVDQGTGQSSQWDREGSKQLADLRHLR